MRQSKRRARRGCIYAWWLLWLVSTTQVLLSLRVVGRHSRDQPKRQQSKKEPLQKAACVFLLTRRHYTRVFPFIGRVPTLLLPLAMCGHHHAWLIVLKARGRHASGHSVMHHHTCASIGVPSLLASACCNPHPLQQDLPNPHSPLRTNHAAAMAMAASVPERAAWTTENHDGQPSRSRPHGASGGGHWKVATTATQQHPRSTIELVPKRS